MKRLFNFPEKSFFQKVEFWLILLGLLLFSSHSVFAGTLNCSGSATATTASYVFYDVSAVQCTISDSAPTQSVGDLVIRILLNNVRVQGLSDNDLGGEANVLTDHQGCTVGDDASKAAGVTCSDSTVAAGTYTASITALVESGVTSTLSVRYTVVSATNVSLDTTNISVSGVPGITSTVTSSTSSSTPPPSLQRAVSRSQTTVVSTNIGTRLANVGSSPVGVGRTTPGAGRTTSGVGRSVPTGNAPTSSGGGTTTGGGTIGAPNSEQTNFSDASYTHGSKELPLRQLAMTMSFDSSNMVLAAAGEDQGPILAPEQRESLLADRPLTVWGHGSFTDVENSRNDSSGDSRYNGDVWGYNLGMDYRLRQNFYVGASLGFSQTDLTTTYNSGTYDEDSWTFTPYAVFSPNDALKFSGMIGYGISEIDLTSTSSTITSSTDSTMWFAAGNVSYKIKPVEDLPLDLKSSIGLVMTNKKVDAYTQSDGTDVAAATSNTRQIKPGFEVAYAYDLDENTVVQPFVKTDFVYDFMDPVNDDANAFDVGGGLRIGSTTGFNGSLEGNTQLGRTDYREYSISGLVAYSFALDQGSAATAFFVEPYVSSDFNKDNQTYGTGLKFNSHGGMISAALGLSQINARENDYQNSKADITLEIKF